jgi:hypothetical protein
METAIPIEKRVCFSKLHLCTRTIQSVNTIKGLLIRQQAASVFSRSAGESGISCAGIPG